MLSKTPKGKDIGADDVFKINLGFSDIKYRIKINQIQLKETKEENQATHDDVQRDRQYETQAAIVRIMKSRKTITYSELQAETIAATRKRGAMKGAEIKVQIDKYVHSFPSSHLETRTKRVRREKLTCVRGRLIEKDYMERDVSADGIVYKYLA